MKILVLIVFKSLISHDNKYEFKIDDKGYRRILQA